MNVDTKEAIEALRDKAKNANDANDALKFSQSALNLAHVSTTLAGIRHLEKS